MVTVSFEYTDAHMSVVDDGSLIRDIEARFIKLCEVFDFEYKRVRMDFEATPHFVFRVLFEKNILTFPHYMNVLSAFAQEFQVNIASAYDSEDD